MEKYEKYKDSGLDWIGQTPEHWEIKRLKYIAYFQRGFDLSSGNFINGKIPVYGSNGIIGYHNKATTKAPSITIGRSGSVGEVNLIKNNYWAHNTALFLLENFHNDIYFLYYLLISLDLKSESSGTAVGTLNRNLIHQIKVGLPPLGEQKTIARFLDRKTAEIDQLIAQKERLIELYEEEKTAIINQAVTKGINSDVKLNPSGIDWLGEIPEHWQEKKIKYIADLRSGSNLTSNEIKDNEKYPVYGGNGLRGYYQEFSHEGNFILIGRQGALCGNINYAKGKFWATDHAVVTKPITEYELIWFGELLRTMNLNQYSVAAAQPGLAVEAIKNLFVPCPPLKEQKAIADYIETECDRIDAKIAKTKRIIELQKEYRTALISEAVTGKIKVPQLH